MGRKEISTNREGRELNFLSRYCRRSPSCSRTSGIARPNLNTSRGGLFLTSFIGTVDRLDRTFAPGRACDAAKLNGRLVHDLRRSAVRNLERAGVSRSVAMKLTGHKTEAVYRRYAITSAAGLSEGVAKLATLHTGPQGSPTVLPFTKGTIRAQFGA